MAIDPEDLRAQLQANLGGPWPPPCALDPLTTASHQREGYRVEHLSYAAEPGDRVPAVLLIPDGVTAANPAPGIVVFHQHNGQWDIGKSEPAGLAGDPTHHTGVDLARAGYVVLCSDSLCFEDRRNPLLPGHRYEQHQAMRYLTQGKSLAWKNILDSRRAVDLLVSRGEVDEHRLGAYGHSMGSSIAWLTGPFEPRLKAIVGNCCMPTYAAIREHGLTHCFTTFVPGWEKYGDTPDIVGLIAPTPLHLNFGEGDSDSPMSGVLPGLNTIAAAYARADAAASFSWFVEEGVGHTLTAAMAQRVLATFERYVGPARHL
jgi:dienelactone hydrolase